MNQQPSEAPGGDQRAPMAVDMEPVDRESDSAVEDPDVWDGPPVQGAELLADIEQFAGRFLALPTQHHLVVLCLWITHTWAAKAFYVTPRLVLSSPEPGSGKTRVLEVLQLLCCNAKLTLSTTTAALYRRIKADEMPPTILQDECDAIFGRAHNSQAEDLRALFNAGYKSGATVDRCEREAGTVTVTEFPVFAPVALAGLISGSVSKHMRTVLDRAVVFRMQRRAPGEHVDEFRGREAASAAAPIQKRLRAWAAEHFDTLEASHPVMPEGVRDRRAECWEALLAIADVADGDWPDRAREACRHFEYGADPDDELLSRGLRLLRDVRHEFGSRDRMHSVDLVAALTSDPASEWADLFGKALDQRGLAQELKRYEVESVDVRIEGSVRKGYMVGGVAGLGRAWARWLPSADSSNKHNVGDNAGPDVEQGSARLNQRNSAATNGKSADQSTSDNVAHVADVAAVQQADELRPPADASDTIDQLLARPDVELQVDVDGVGQAPGADQLGQPQNGLCQQCGSRLGSSTGKCVPCIIKRVGARA